MLLLGATLGDDGGDPNVAALQSALVALSQVSGRFDINPGPVNGIVTDQTVQATAASLEILGSDLSYWQQVSIKAALLFGASTDTAHSAVANNAALLAGAAVAATAKLKAAIPQYGFPLVAQNFLASPLGLGVILIGLIVGLKLISNQGHHA